MSINPPSIIALLACSVSVAAPLASGASAAPAAPAPSPAPKQLDLPFSGQPDVWVQGEAPASWLPRELYVYECWATWCGPCVASMPHLEELHRSLEGEKNIHILGINLDNGMTPDRLKQFIDSKLKVSFPIGLASQKTQEQWMRPLEVRTIPFTFAVRDGKVVWKGSPRQLSADLLKRLAQGLPAGNSPAESRQDALASVRGIFEAIARNNIDDAKRIAAEQDARKSTPGQPAYGTTIFLIRSLVANNHASEAIDLAAKLAQNQPEDASLLAALADALYAPLVTASAPTLQANRPALEAALAYAQKADNLEQKAGKKGRRTLLLVAEVLEKLNRPLEARPYLLRAISRSEYGIVWDLIQQKTEEDLPLADVLHGTVKALVAADAQPKATAESPQTPTRWERIVPDDPMNALFRQIDWGGSFHPKGTPADGTLLISLWKNQQPLDAQLKLHGWNRPNLYRAVILCGDQLSPPQPSKAAPWPTGQLTDPAPLLRLLEQKHTRLADGPLPEAALWKNGKLLWVGDVAYMPSWVGELLNEKDFDYARFQSERQKEEEELNRAQDIFKQAIALNKEKKWDESCRLIENHLEELYCYPGLALHAEEQLAGADYRKKDYAAVNRRMVKLMNTFPLEFTIYSNINNLLGSDERLQDACYPANMQALQGMADTNLRSDPEYNAACYTVMAQLALKKGQTARARELCLRALATSSIVRRYLAVAP